MSKANRSLIAIALFVLAGTGAAGASQRGDSIAFSALAPVAAFAGDIRPAADVIPSDLGTPSTGNSEQHVAKTGLFSSIKNAAKKVGGAVKSAAKKVGGAAKTVAKKIGGAVKTAAKKAWPVIKKIIKIVAKLPKPPTGPGPGPTIPTPRR